jgi:hypothetical protein
MKKQSIETYAIYLLSQKLKVTEYAHQIYSISTILMTRTRLHTINRVGKTDDTGTGLLAEAYIVYI